MQARFFEAVFFARRDELLPCPSILRKNDSTARFILKEVGGPVQFWEKRILRSGLCGSSNCAHNERGNKPNSAISNFFQFKPPFVLMGRLTSL